LRGEGSQQRLERARAIGCDIVLAECDDRRRGRLDLAYAGGDDDDIAIGIDGAAGAPDSDRRIGFDRRGGRCLWIGRRERREGKQGERQRGGALRQGHRTYPVGELGFPARVAGCHRDGPRLTYKCPTMTLSYQFVAAQQLPSRFSFAPRSLCARREGAFAPECAACTQAKRAQGLAYGERTA
jgi:hypothetical protein